MTSLSPIPSLTTLVCLPSSFAFEPLTSKYDLWQITINSKEDRAVDFFNLKNDSAHDTQQWELVAKIYAVL